ncbi:MAG: response regulator [Bacteroidetes bacterium]|nr:response regulator [Bacteroidota bacterium]
MRLLIVDDAPENILVLRKMLSEFKFEEVGSAGSGEDALSLLKDRKTFNQFDIILMDISMPGIDGIEATRMIREDDDLRDIPVIMVTGYGSDEYLATAFSAGANDYLTRPVKKIEIYARVKAALRLKQAIDERKNTIAELQSALNNIKTLSGLLPICASCKKIRDDRGFWNQVETYIMQHTDASFTHGYCPECTDRFKEEYKRK